MELVHLEEAEALLVVELELNLILAKEMVKLVDKLEELLRVEKVLEEKVCLVVVLLELLQVLLL